MKEQKQKVEGENRRGYIGSKRLRKKRKREEKKEGGVTVSYFFRFSFSIGNRFCEIFNVGIFSC
jgi:hypothetical protein